MSRNRKFKAALKVAAAPLALKAAFTGLAVSGAVLPAGAYAQGDTITVTATRRETDLQETPVAVSALNDETVESIVPRDLGDIAQLVPNFSASKVTGFNAASFAIRGAAQTDIIVYSEPQVGVTLDDFVVPHVQTQLLDLFDIEQVEILRGPQGTLFGKNTTAGVVNVRTKQPILGEVGAEARVQYGSYNRVEARGALNVPFGDQFALRVAAQYQGSDGYYKNGASFGPTFNVPVGAFFSGRGDGRRLGGEDVVNMRAKMLWQPMDNLSAVFQYELVRDNSDTVPAVNETPLDTTPLDPSDDFVFPNLGYAIDPGDPLDNAGVTSGDSIGVDIGSRNGHQVDVNGYYLNINWDVNDRLTIKSITGYREQHSELWNNYVGEVGPISQFDANRADDRETFQQEIRFNYEISDQIDVVAGGFYQTNDTTFCVTQTLGFLDLFGLTLPFGTFNDNPQVLCNAQDATAYALYGDMTYGITDRLTLAGGVRYTWEDKDWIGRNQVFYQVLGGGFDPTLSFATLGPLGAADFSRFSTGVLESSAEFEEPSWRGVVSYAFTDDLFGYASVSHSFRSGAYNDQSGTTGNELTPAGVAATRPETVTSYEAGLRMDLADGAIRFNPTFFYAKYKDAQRQIAATLTNSAGVEFQETRFFNAAELEIYGIEIESQWYTPIQGLMIGGNFSYQDGEFERFEADTNFDGTIDVDFSGRPLTRTPEKTWTVFGRYEREVGDKILRLGATAAHEDEQIFNYSDIGPQFDTTLNARTLVSATLELASGDDRWFARVFGRNLTDERYRVSSQPVANLWIFSQYGEPRVFGIEIGVKN